MGTLKTKSQMLNRIAELNERVAELEEELEALKEFTRQQNEYIVNLLKQLT